MGRQQRRGEGSEGVLGAAQLYHLPLSALTLAHIRTAHAALRQGPPSCEDSAVDEGPADEPASEAADVDDDVPLQPQESLPPADTDTAPVAGSVSEADAVTVASVSGADAATVA